VFVAVHIVAIVSDTYVHFGLVDVLVPFASTWNPSAVALGIVSLYLLLAIELTSLLRQHLPRKLWRRVHFASFPLFVLATLHLLTAGTDTASAPLQALVLAVIVAVGGLTTVRCLDGRTVVSRTATP
jgi:predicted ferric reductase